MRFGAFESPENWQDRLKGEVTVNQTYFEVPSDAARHSASESPRIQFGQWPTSRGIHFDRERND